MSVQLSHISVEMKKTMQVSRQTIVTPSAFTSAFLDTDYLQDRRWTRRGVNSPGAVQQGPMMAVEAHGGRSAAFRKTGRTTEAESGEERVKSGGWGAGSGRRPYRHSRSGRCARRQETSHDRAAATVGGVSGAERGGPPYGGGAPQRRGAGRTSAGCNRHRLEGRGGAPGAPKREAIGPAARAEVGYRTHQCGPVREATGTGAGQR